jgi:hypothetical protein
MTVSDETLHRLTENNKICAYAMKQLGCDERRAAALAKVAGDFLTWNATTGLRFKSTQGEIDADDPVAIGFLSREFDFIVPGKAVEGEQAALSANDIALAKGGNITAKSRLFTALHADKPRTEEPATLAALDKLLAGEASEKKIAAGGDSGSNPWGSGPGEFNVTKQGQLIKMLINAHGEEEGLKRAGQIAAAAGSKIGATRPARAA